MLSKKSEEVLRRWLEDDLLLLFRWRMKCAAFIVNKIPKRLRFWGATHLVFRALLIGSAPASAAIYGSVDWGMAAAVGGGLVVLNLISTLADRLSKNASSPPDYTEDSLVRVGDLLTSYKPSAVKGGTSKETAIEACLGIIENVALQHSKSKKREIAVTLILYVGTGNNRMKVRMRNPGNTRPKNRDFPTERILGHHVCQCGDAPRVVNHIGHFGKEFAASPTQTSYNYKSILIMPIHWDNGVSGKEAKGFISIDCNRSYAFYGNRASEIAVMCRPIIGQLREMV